MELEPFLKSVYSRANCLHPQAFFVRLDSRCNQKCGFCNILGPNVHFKMDTGYVRGMLRQIAAIKADATVNFTGGEPTLRRDLPDLVRYAKTVHIKRVVLQTNATRFADSDYVRKLVDAGLDDALVSFHSCVPEISDKLTGAPGTWKKTVAGIQNALQIGIPITTNIVLTTENVGHLSDTVRFALTHFGGLSGIILSPLQPHGDLLNHLELLPRYSDLTTPVKQAAELIRAADKNLYLSYCENPLCWLLDTFGVEGDTELRQYIARRLHANDCGDCHLSTMMDKDKVKPPVCDDCHLDGVCFGIWRKYVDIFGAHELKAVPIPAGGRPLKKPFSVARHMSDDAGNRQRVPLTDTTLARFSPPPR